jgi:dUTP pyrophosphatase
MLINLDRTEPVVLHRGDRIAQLVIQQVESARFVEVDELPGSMRGEGGYGSTGGFTHRPTEEKS